MNKNIPLNQNIKDQKQNEVYLHGLGSTAVMQLLHDSI